MKQLLEFILKGIVSKPESVIITDTLENNTLTLKVGVSDEDYGAVIGKGGRTIKAIRDILRLKALKDNSKFNLIIDEPEKKITNVD